MELIARYPMQECHLTAHCGKAVYGMTTGGDTFCAILDRVEDGRVYFRPFEGSEAQVASLKKQAKNRLQAKNVLRHSPQDQVKTKAWWGPWGGWGWWYPLWALTALWLFPLAWI